MTLGLWYKLWYSF